jgi:hypothetical protein
LGGWGDTFRRWDYLAVGDGEYGRSAKYASAEQLLTDGSADDFRQQWWYSISELTLGGESGAGDFVVIRKRLKSGEFAYGQ